MGMDTAKNLLDKYGIKYEEEVKANDKPAVAAAKKAWSSTKKVLNAIAELNEKFETMTRFAVYESNIKLAMKEESVTSPTQVSETAKRKAATLARDATVDFAQTGNLGALANTLFAFTNASMVGSGVMLNTLASKKGATVAVALTGLGFLQAMLADDGEDEEPKDDKVDRLSQWDKLSDYKKSTKWNIRAGNHWTQIPLTYGWNVFPALGAKIYDVRKGTARAGSLVGSTFSNLLNAYSPIQTDNVTLTQAISPTMIRPFVDIKENRDFMGGRIHQEDFGEKGAPYAAWRKASNDTPSPYKAFARSMRMVPGASALTPDDWQYLLQSYLGGFGGGMKDATRSFTSMTKGTGLKIATIPFVNKFIGDTDENGRKYKNYFFDTRDILKDYAKDKATAEQNYEAYFRRTQKPMPESLKGEKSLEKLLEIEKAVVSARKDFGDILEDISMEQDWETRKERYKEADEKWKNKILPVLVRYYNYHHINEKKILQDLKSFHSRANKIYDLSEDVK
jgi:hypothetical protein